MQLRARQAHSSTALADVMGLRDELMRMKRLLGLVKRREKLKLQIAQLQQAHFEVLVKERKAAGGFPSTASPALLPRAESSSSLPPEGSAGGSPAGKRPKLEDEPAGASDTGCLLHTVGAEGSGGGEGSSDTSHRRSGRATKDREKFEL